MLTCSRRIIHFASRHLFGRVCGRGFSSTTNNNNMAECGSLLCQHDSYATSVSTKVISSTPSLGEDRKYSDYAIQLEDTVLFPEGGGQPDDRGTINGLQVNRVLRRGAVALHFMKEPLEPGTSVDVEVNWERRFDHMQQHSGQHLITAVTEREYGFKTTSWNLAIGKENRCFVELDTKSLTPDQMNRIEDICNDLIRSGVAMTPRWCSPGSPEMEEVRSRGLPDDFEGSCVRVVEINGLDSNMCCGTHVKSLSHLQCVKLLYCEARKGFTLLYYMVGGRVLGYTKRALDNERMLTKMLSVGLDGHVDAVDKIQRSNKSALKLLRTQLKEIAQLLAYQHLHSDPLDMVSCIHRDDGDVEFMNIIANQLSPHGVFVMASVGGNKGRGQFLLSGKDEDIELLGPKIAACFDGKGGGRKGRYQGKAQKLEMRVQAETTIRDYFTQKQF